MNVRLDHLVDTDLVLHLLEGTNEFLRILVLLYPEGFECLVVGDVLEQCLIASCVLGVVRLEVRLIASLLPWSSGKSERRKCSTLRKLITSIK